MEKKMGEKTRELEKEVLKAEDVIELLKYVFEVYESEEFQKKEAIEVYNRIIRYYSVYFNVEEKTSLELSRLIVIAKDSFETIKDSARRCLYLDMVTIESFKVLVSRVIALNKVVDDALSLKFFEEAYRRVNEKC